MRETYDGFVREKPPLSIEIESKEIMNKPESGLMKTQVMEHTVLKSFLSCDVDMDDKMAHYASEIAVSTSRTSTRCR